MEFSHDLMLPRTRLTLAIHDVRFGSLAALQANTSRMSALERIPDDSEQGFRGPTVKGPLSPGADIQIAL